MDLAPLSFVLAVSTAWAAIFLGFLPAQTLRLEAREVLKLGGAWIAVGLTSPSAICHWYFIFALICLGSWIKFRTEHALAGKVWLNIAAGLGISIGLIFFLQAAPALLPINLPPRGCLLLLASIYLGGATTGLGYAGGVRATPGQARLLMVLAVAWCAVIALELVSKAWPAGTKTFPATLLLTVMLSLLAFRAARANAWGRAKWIFILVALVAFGAQIFARRLVL